MGLGKNYLQIKGREKENNNSSDNNLLQAGCSRSNAFFLFLWKLQWLERAQ